MRGKRLFCGTAAFILAAVLLSTQLNCRAYGNHQPVREALFDALERLGFVLDEPISASTLPESEAADRSVLKNSCIIGHSHAVGMQMTLDVEGLDYIAEVGMSAQGMLTNDKFPLPNGGTGGLAYALSLKNYERVYVFLGCNDMLGGTYYLSEFKGYMEEILNLLKEYQPEADICLLSIAPLGESFFSFCRDNYGLTQEIAEDYNYTLRALATEYGVDYLDITSPLSDENGFLAPEYNRGDGLHFNGEGNLVLLNTILTHWGD